MDWYSNVETFTFYDEPHMNGMTFSFANLQGSIFTDILGINFRPDVTSVIFGVVEVAALIIGKRVN